MAPTGICTARITVHDWTYPATFIILQQCSHDIVLDMDFLNQHGTIIDLKSKSITLFKGQAILLERCRSHRALSVLDNQVSIPPHSSIIISNCTETSAGVEGTVKGDQRLLPGCEI